MNVAQRQKRRRESLGHCSVDFPRSLLPLLKMVAAAAKEKQPDTIRRVLGPALEAELKQLTNRK
jgi:hypothetical protein